MDYFELLIKKLKRPNVVYNCGNEQLWKDVEKDMGIIFPNDYKKLINYYGTGGIDNFFWILTPFESDQNVNFKIKYKIMLEGYSELKALFPEDYIYDVFPKKNGILPCGYAENGDELYWLTSESEEKWKIVLFDSAFAEFRCYDMGLVEFIYKILVGEVKCQLVQQGMEKTFCSIQV